MTTLYQYCTTCQTETGHTWIKDLVNQCVVCKRENKVSPAQVFVRPEKYAHLQKDEYEELMGKIEEQPEAKLEIPEVKAEEKLVPANVIHEPVLPVQGIFTKPTPLEPKEQNGLYPRKSVQMPMECIVESETKKPLTSHKIILVDFSKEGAEFFVDPKDAPNWDGDINAALKKPIPEGVGIQEQIEYTRDYSALTPEAITKVLGDMMWGTSGPVTPEEQKELKEMFEDPKNYEQEFIPDDHGSYIIDREGGLPNIEHPPKNLQPPKKKGWADSL